jgi:integrase
MNKQGKASSFLSSYHSKNTRLAYEQALAQFFKNVYGENGELDTSAKRYFGEKRDYESDIEEFLDSISGLAPKSVKLKLAIVKTFLIENDVELKSKFWRKLSRKVKGSRALTLDKVPANKELRKIIMHLPVQGKALFLTLSSSGMRIGEALQLKLNDVKLSQEPALINIRGEYSKTGNSRFAFISKEAREAIEQWLNKREVYLEAAVAKSHKYEKEAEDNRLFPFETSTAYMMWTNALTHAKKAERDNSTNRHRIHPHVLRKFFRTRMATLIPVDVVEALMGHEGYLIEVYRRYTQEDLAKFYLQGESSLLVFTEAEEVSRLRVEVDERNKQLQTLANGLAAENLDLKARVARVEAENAEFRKRQINTESKLADLEKLLRENLAQLR